MALTAVGFQACAALTLSLAFLAKDGASALAAGIGGSAVVLGSLLMALRSFAGEPVSAGMALTRLFAGLVLKWFVVLGAMYLALARFELPALPLVAGMAGTTLAFLLIGKFKA